MNTSEMKIRAGELAALISDTVAIDSKEWADNKAILLAVSKGDLASMVTEGPYKGTLIGGTDMLVIGGDDGRG